MRDEIVWKAIVGTSVLLLSCESSPLESRSLMDVIPPTAMTETELSFTYQRIRRFWNTHEKVPNSLSELPILKGRDCSAQDSWGRPLHFESDGNARVKLWSLGRDGKPGGSGEDADMEVEFIGIEPDQVGFAEIRRSDAVSVHDAR